MDTEMKIKKVREQVRAVFHSSYCAELKAVFFVQRLGNGD